MTLQFKDLELADLPGLAELFARYPQRLCCFCVQSLFAWNIVLKYKWALLDADTVVFSFQPLEQRERQFFQPVGGFGPAARAALEGHFQSLGYPAAIYNTSERFIRENPAFAGLFTETAEEGLNNYIYAAGDLADLPGKAYARKRTMIATSRREYGWTVQPVTERNYHECSEIIQAWRAWREDEDKYRDVEMIAAHNAVLNFPALGYRGVLIHIGDRPAAFSLFAPLNPRLAVVNFMRADSRYKGLSEAVFCETARVIQADGFVEINLEEDWENPGIRRFKQSYRPSELLPSRILTRKSVPT